MKIGILHLTDMHAEANNDFLSSLASKIVTACRSDFVDSEIVFVVFSGDIAQTGKKEEYDIAKRFLLSLKSLLTQFVGDKIYQKIIAVPGNHDCNFNLEQHIRKLGISDLSYNTIGNDGSVIKLATAIQQPFYEFLNELNGESNSNDIYTSYKVEVEGTPIVFNCFNTSWCSSIDEKVGSLFYPVNLIRQSIPDQHLLSISVLHHHPAWMSPNTEKNNRREFEEFLSENSDIVLIGHEHESVKEISPSSEEGEIVRCFTGSALYSRWKTKITAGFQSLVVDVSERTVSVKPYEFSFKEELFIQTEPKDYTLKKRASQYSSFVLNPAFLETLSTLEIPIVKDSRIVNIEDLFVYPDLEQAEDLNKEIDARYLDSSSLILDTLHSTIIIEGENQSGKTSLIKMLFLQYLRNGVYPLKLNGSSLRSGKLELDLKRAYEEQYRSHRDFEAYRQFDNSKKVIFIDDLNNSELNNEQIKSVINKLKTLFDKIYITTSPRMDFLPIIEALDKDALYGRILPLGHTKRATLIENFYRKAHPHCIIDQSYIEGTRKLFEEVENILGNRLIPAYPIFIVSILQSMEMMAPLKSDQTSYGYCYQTLIHYALAVRAKIKNDDIESYFNFLSDLAYWIYRNNNNEEWFSEKEFSKFHEEYSKSYLFVGFSTAETNLLKSGIIISNSDGEFKFGYIYIYYFLVARKFADLLNNKDGDEMLRDLCNNLQDDRSANILILCTHHTNNSKLIEEAVFATMLPFDNITPITLTKNGEYYNLINGIVDDVADEIISSDINPLEERRKRLKAKDELLKHEIQAVENEDLSSLPEEMIWMRQAIRSVEILGQIIKNRKGSIPKIQLVEMAKELFNTAFRTIGFFGSIISQSKEQIIETIKKSQNEYDSCCQITTRVNQFINTFALKFCLAVFSKVIHSVGLKDLKEIFNSVSIEIGTPAAHILAFSINTCYDRLSIRELKQIHKEFSSNPVVMKILKARVKSYLYNNKVEHDKKAQIVALFNWRVSPDRLLPQRCNR